MRLVDKEQTMTKQLIGLLDPNGTVFEKNARHSYFVVQS